MVALVKRHMRRRRHWLLARDRAIVVRTKGYWRRRWLTARENAIVVRTRAPEQGRQVVIDEVRAGVVVGHVHEAEQ